MSNKPKDVTPTDSNNTGNMTDKQALSVLKKNASNIVTAIAVVLTGYFGWTYFQENKSASIDTVASEKFAKIEASNQQVMMANSGMELPKEMQEKLSKDKEQMTADIDALIAEHGESVYAWQALMIKARNQTDTKDYKGAVETLKSASAMNIEDAGLKSIAQLRYAQALLANNQPDEALTVVNNEMPASFEASKQEILGDVYLAKKEESSAKSAYEQAWKLLSERQENRQLLALKMQSLSMEFEPIEEELVISMPTQQASQPASNVATKSVETDNNTESNEKDSTATQDENKDEESVK